MRQSHTELRGEGHARAVLHTVAVQHLSSRQRQLVGDLHAMAIDRRGARSNHHIAILHELPQVLESLLLIPSLEGDRLVEVHRIAADFCMFLMLFGFIGLLQFPIILVIACLWKRHSVLERHELVSIETRHVAHNIDVAIADHFKRDKQTVLVELQIDTLMRVIYNEDGSQL